MYGEIAGRAPGKALPAHAGTASSVPRNATAYVLVALGWLVRQPVPARARSGRRRLATDPGA